MASFGGFYKGEKKKKKKDTAGNAQSFSDKPVFSLPKMVEKKKKNNN
jgi:hypothetical protein